MNRYNKLITIKSMIWNGFETIQNITSSSTALLNQTLLSNSNSSISNSNSIGGIGSIGSDWYIHRNTTGYYNHYIGNDHRSYHGDMNMNVNSSGTHTIELILENPNEIPIYALNPTSLTQYQDHTQYQHKDWKSVITIQVVHTLGTLCLYAVFVLLATYWAHMLRKIDFNATTRYNRSLLATSWTWWVWTDCDCDYSHWQIQLLGQRRRESQSH